MRSKKGRRAATSAVALCACGAGTLAGCAYTDLCSEVAACTPDPEPPPGLCDGEPDTAPALDECGVFVSEQGDDNSPGTKGAPVRTLPHAIGLAAHGRGRGEAPTRRVYACGGEFAEKIALPSGVDLWGGRLCDGGDWSYEGSFGGPDHPTIIAPPVGIPLRVIAGEAAAMAAMVGPAAMAAQGAAATRSASPTSMRTSSRSRALPIEIGQPGKGGTSWNHDGSTTVGESGEAHATLRFPEERE
jgi:hypothetical protein